MNENSAAEDGLRFEHVVLPGVETAITVRVSPHAVCWLSHDSVDAPPVQLDADIEGNVRFHARPRGEASPVELRLEEELSDGQRRVHTVSLTPDGRAWVERRHDPAALPAGGTLIPALREDPRDLSNEELVRRGYPPRPGDDAPPARLARWRRLVSTDYIRVDETRIPHEDVRFSVVDDSSEVMSPTLPLPPPSERSVLLDVVRSFLPHSEKLVSSVFNGSSSNWSGAYLTQPANEFFLVEAEWNVPRVYPNGVAYAAAAEWIGMGNSGSDLFQSGTDSEVWDLGAPFNWTFTRYWMWIEALPYAPWAVVNFPVDPGDHVSVTIFVANSFGTTSFANDTWGGLTARDDNVWFMLYNETKRRSYWGTLPTVDGRGRFRFQGQTAEFIVERPSSSKGGTYPLANFCLASMRNCAFSDAQYGSKLFPLEPDDGSQPFAATLTYLNMDNGPTRLATAVSVTDSNSFGELDLLWVFSHSS